MRVTTLKPRIQAANLSRIQAAPNVAVERKRGYAGVKDRERIRARDCGLCQACKREGKVTLGVDVDHIRPLWEGGSDDDDNKELLCTPHHEAKTAAEAARRAGGG
ncbi:HNH endonuclease [Massilia agilis]|uniref:HNH endonuclease n=1 Tax=Massilia agilis TaxID=1811226 RepID=A0ABT2DBJ9_9BURK|nr:HNH endonuclease signature motif containing protein [Massilia agilis]MCS0808675.1 HNH endonuclease [Massilia agilis]